MFWAPQAAFAVVPAAQCLVAVDSWGQPAVQQPMQVVGVFPAVNTGVSGMTGFVHGVAGMVLGGASAWNGSNANQGRRGRRQQRKQQANPAEQFHDCREEADAEPQQDEFEELSSPNKMYEESQQDEAEMDKLMQQLEAGGMHRHDALEDIRGRVLELAMDSAGCRVVQLALDLPNTTDKLEMANELKGNVWAAIESKHANYVLQKIIEVLPISSISFVIDELQDMVGDVARHQKGCRVLCRLVEHAAAEPLTTKLISTLVADANELSRHNYGHHVLRSLLEHGLPADRHQIAVALCQGAHRNAKHKTASFVVEKALAYCQEDAQKLLATELLQYPGTTVDLARHQYGRHVVSQMVRLPNDCSTRALDNLRHGFAQVQTSKHGRRLIAELQGQLFPQSSAAV